MELRNSFVGNFKRNLLLGQVSTAWEVSVSIFDIRHLTPYWTLCPFISIVIDVTRIQIPYKNQELDLCGIEKFLYQQLQAQSATWSGFCSVGGVIKYRRHMSYTLCLTLCQFTSVLLDMTRIQVQD